MSRNTMDVHVLNTGCATAPEWILIQGGGRAATRVPALVALLHHPREGWGLFDTGIAPRVRAAMGRGVFRLYRDLVPMSVSTLGSVADQLSRFSLETSDISWVVLSHFHADHVGGLADFVGARWITSRAAYDDVRTRTGVSALMRGFVPSLLPPDFAARATLLPEFAGDELRPFGRTHDLFGDGSARLVSLPGHARGQIGMVARTPTGPVLLAADGCWLSRSIRENRSPHWITGVIVDSSADVRRTVTSLHAFARDNPETPIIPSHCPEAHARWVGGDIT